MPTESRARSSPYRPEIEGVRAIAALLVATFHIWLGRVSGGVDVFFVMSGFLITLTLSGHLQKFGRIDVPLYLGRLLRRLLPAALLVLATVLICTWLFLPRVLWVQTLRELIAATLYVENWQLALNSVDYLAQFTDHTLVQHFWAMSIQGQFYLVWLAMFLSIAWVCRRWAIERHKVALAFFLTLFTVSLAFSIVSTRINQPFAYFDTRARVWEFALGGLAAVLLPRLQLPQTAKVLLGWVGLGAILSCGLLFQVSTLFPSYAALWPTMGAVLVLAAGGSQSRWGADRFLAFKPLVALGGISYGVYLWHWPVLEFYRSVTGQHRLGWRKGLLILGVSVLLAWLTQRLVENPIQNAGQGSRIKRGAGLPVALAIVLALIGGSLATVWHMDVLIQKDLTTTNRLESQPASARGRCFGAAALPDEARECPLSINARNIVPQPVTTAFLEDSPCTMIEQTQLMEVCAFAVPSAQARKTVLLVGDSHSMTLRVLVDELARHNQWHAIAISEGGCLPSMAPRVSAVTGSVEDCIEWNKEMIGWVNRHPEIDTLFTMAASGRRLQPRAGMDNDQTAVEGYLEEWAAMKTIHHVVVLRDSPRLMTDVLQCVERSMRAGKNPAEHCRRPRASALLFDPAVAAARSGRAAARADVIDLTDHFCDDRYCYPVIGGVLAYRDGVHLNRLFGRTLAPFALARAAPIFEQTP